MIITRQLRNKIDKTIHTCDHLPENAEMSEEYTLLTIGTDFVRVLLCDLCWKAIVYKAVTEFNQDSQRFIIPSVYNTYNRG